MNGYKKVLLILTIIGLWLLQACISDNTDAYNLQKNTDPVITVKVKSGESTMIACSDEIDNDEDAGWDYIGGDTINKEAYQIQALSGEDITVLLSYEIKNPRDSVENNGIDCNDFECKRFEHCLDPVENQLSLCTDSLDNDDDGKTDCEDTDCKDFSHCMENTDTTCTDGEDNDFDDLIDCNDPGCFGLIACNGITYDTVPTSPGMLVVFRDQLPEAGLSGDEEKLYQDSSEYMMPVGSLPSGIPESIHEKYEGVQWRYNCGGTEGNPPLKDQSVDEDHIQPYFEIVSGDECDGGNGDSSIDGGECIKISFPDETTCPARWGGAFIQFGDYLIDVDESMAGSKSKRDNDDLRDLSKWSHNKIKFELRSKGPVGLKVQWGTDMTGQAGATYRDYSLLNEGYKDEDGKKVLWEDDGNWHSVELDVDDDIGADDFQIFSNPLGFWTDGDMHTIYIDNIRYEGKSEQLCAFVGKIYMCNNE
ncbi:MAG: hypothetical protein OCD76_14770 [Reichenbachiella sp.]